MKNSSKKILTRVLCVLLSVVLLVSISLNIMAEDAGNAKLYVKDTKLIYAESLEEAKTQVPEGYKLLEYDLNKGTEYVFDVYEVYMAYSTTTNPDEAITDMKMMNMNGGYVYSDYEEQLKQIDDSVREVVDQFVSAADAFVEKLKRCF